MTYLLKKKQFCWDATAQEAFDKLKLAMTKTPVLALPDFSQQFELETDACDTRVGAVLLQNNKPCLSQQALSTATPIPIYV